MNVLTRNLAGLSSEESLSTRLRPGVSPSGSKVSTARSLPSSTFQEELMRLIDPEVSLAELETTFHKVSIPSTTPFSADITFFISSSWSASV